MWETSCVYSNAFFFRLLLQISCTQPSHLRDLSSLHGLFEAEELCEELILTTGSCYDLDSIPGSHGCELSAPLSDYPLLQHRIRLYQNLSFNAAHGILKTCFHSFLTINRNCRRKKCSLCCHKIHTSMILF